MTNISVGMGGYVATGSDRQSFTVHEVLDDGKTLKVSFDDRKNVAVWPEQDWVTISNNSEDSMFTIKLCNRGKKKGKYTSNGRVDGTTYYVGHRSNYCDPHF